MGAHRRAPTTPRMLKGVGVLSRAWLDREAREEE